MKGSLSLATLAFTGYAAAYPSILAHLQERDGSAAPQMAAPEFKRQTPGFDAATQYVSNKGAHAFVPPSGNDQRGPCPGLNAMANQYVSLPSCELIVKF